MQIWIIWLIIAAMLLIIEVLSQMVWTLCLAIGAVVALAVDLLGGGLEWQLIAMALSTVASYIIVVPLVKRWHEVIARGKGRESRTGMEALLGRTAIVTHEIKPGRMGRARIDGDSWQVVAPGVARTIQRGEEVSVSAYDSIILTVRPK